MAKQEGIKRISVWNPYRDTQYFTPNSVESAIALAARNAVMTGADSDVLLDTINSARQVLNSVKVATVKGLYAEIIDFLNDLRISDGSPEIKRLASVAITEAQGAQMWAVKALTWKD